MFIKRVSTFGTSTVAEARLDVVDNVPQSYIGFAHLVSVVLADLHVDGPAKRTRCSRPGEVIASQKQIIQMLMNSGSL